MISLLIWLFLGFVAGYIAKLIMPGPDGGGVVMTIILGIVGAVVGGFIGRYFLGYPMISSFDNIAGTIPSFIFSIIGAIVVLALYRLATGRRITAQFAEKWKTLKQGVGFARNQLPILGCELQNR